MFVPWEVFNQASCIFSSKAGAYPVEQLAILHSAGKSLTVPANIGLARKSFSETKALAYCIPLSVMKEKGFIALTQGACTIKHFALVK